MDRVETPGEFLARLGVDGAKWAAEFGKMIMGFEVLPGSAIHTWFANAIEAGISEGYSRCQRDAAERAARIYNVPVELIWPGGHKERQAEGQESGGQQVDSGGNAESGKPE